MYHRVAQLHADPWQLAVSPANFEEQVKLLTENYNVVTPQQIIRQLEKKSISSNQVCISFDDGYLDNYSNAVPVLEKYQCPASFFIATYFLQNQQPFWWDELQELIFSSPQLPSPFCFSIKGEDVNIALEYDGQLTGEQQEKQDSWIWSDEAATQRCQLYFSLWEKMRPLPQPEIELIMARLKTYAGVAHINMSHAMPMSFSQLKKMSESEYVQIGLHTHTHPVLSDHSLEFQRNELEENKLMLEGLCEHPINTISFPHGKYNDDTLSVIKSLGVEAAFTTKGGSITTPSPRHELGRYQVLNHNADEFKLFMRHIFDK